MAIKTAIDAAIQGTALSNREKARLVAFYKDAFERIAASLDRHVWSNPSNPRVVALLTEIRTILSGLDENATRWAERHVVALYRGNMRWVDGTLIANRIPRASVARARASARIHQEAIRALVLDPTTGITPRLLAASRQVGQSVQAFVMSNRTMLDQARLVSNAVARNIITGTGSQEARNEILRSLLAKGGLPKRGFMGLNPFLEGAKSLIEAPYIRIPLKDGGERRMHIFDHVQMTAQTMESKVRTEARKNQMIQHGIRLAQISPNPPLTNCVCALYAGRVVSLDMETEKQTGFPYVGRLPNGGPPFHPNCGHTLLPWVTQFVEKKEIENATTSGAKAKTFGGSGIPVGALNGEFKDAMRFFRDRGGISFAAKQNPTLRARGANSMADEVVRKALR